MESDTPAHEAEVERHGSRVDLRVTVPAATVSDHVDEVSKAFRGQAKISGFRRGKAPMSMIRQRFRDDIREHVLEHLIPRHVSSELESRGIEPLHNPVLDDVDFDFDGPLTFRVHFDVRPEVEIQGYRDLQATRRVHRVTDDIVSRAMGDLRERAAQLEPVEGAPVHTDDYVRAELTLLPRDGKGKKLAEENRWIHVGHEQAIPGLNSQLEDLEVGDTREFVTRLADAYPNDMLAGKEVTCRVEVEEIKRRHLPPVDDDLAKDLGLDDLAELRDRVRADLEQQVAERAEQGVEQELLEQVLEANDIEAPESLVEDQLDRFTEGTARELAQQGVDPREGVDWRSFRAERRETAVHAVQRRLALDAIADAEEIEVEDAAVVARIERHPRAAEEDPRALVQQMRQDGSFEGVRSMLRRERALALVKESATIDSVEVEPAEETVENVLDADSSDRDEPGIVIPGGSSP